MSAVCESFQANAWKRDFCSYCFKSKEEHDSYLNHYIPTRTGHSHRQASATTILRTKSNLALGLKSNKETLNAGKVLITNGVTMKPAGILKKQGSRKTTSGVKFPDEVVQVIGYGGQETLYSDDEDVPDNGSLKSDSEDEVCTEEERHIRMITQKNTTFNSISENLLNGTSPATTQAIKFHQITEAVSEVLTSRKPPENKHYPLNFHNQYNNKYLESKNQGTEHKKGLEPTADNSSKSSSVHRRNLGSNQGESESEPQHYESTSAPLINKDEEVITVQNDRVVKEDTSSVLPSAGHMTVTAESLSKVLEIDLVVSSSAKKENQEAAPLTYGKETVKAFYSNVDGFAEIKRADASLPSDGQAAPFRANRTRAGKKTARKQAPDAPKGLQEKLRAIEKSLEDNRHENRVLLPSITEIPRVRRISETRKKSPRTSRALRKTELLALSSAEEPDSRSENNRSNQLSIRAANGTSPAGQGRLALTEDNRKKHHFSIRKLLGMKRNTRHHHDLTNEQELKLIYPKAKTYIFQSLDLNNGTVQATAIKSIEVNHSEYNGAHRSEQDYRDYPDSRI